ncbi:MAG: DUF2793 domain-containing protein [Xanthobacter sp.]
MTDQSARLGLPYLAAAQAQKHVTHNEALRGLDALVHLSLESVTTQAPPEGPAEGQCWFVPEGATGAFAGHEGQMACWEAGIFDFLDLPEGAQAFIRDEWRIALFAEGGWVSPLASTPSRAAIEARVMTEDVILSGAYVETQMSIPDRAIVLGVSTRTLSPVTGATSYDCGVAGESGKFGGVLSIQRGGSNAGIIGPTAFYTPTPVRLTANGGAFTGGRVRVGLHYLMCPVAGSGDEESWWLEPSLVLDDAAPTLAADFVRERYVQDGVPCAADELFTRSGSAKWVMDAHGAFTRVPANVLAFDHASGRRRMVLEGAASNLLQHSADLTEATWLKNEMTVTAVNGRFKLIPSLETQNHFIRPSTFFTYQGGQSYVVSAVLQMGEYPYARLTFEGSAIWEGGTQPSVTFGLEIGEPLVQTGSVTAAGMEPMGHGLYRCWMCATIVAEVSSGTTRCALWVPHENGSNAPFAGNGVSGLYVHQGLQVENGVRPTSYIPTTSAAVTRLADHCAWSAAASGRISDSGPCAVVWRGGVRDADGLQHLIGLSGSHPLLGTTGSGDAVALHGGTELANGSNDVPGDVAIAAGWDASDRVLSVNGRPASFDHVQMSVPMEGLSFGSANGMRAGARQELDEMLIWAIRGSATSLQQQARNWG